MKCYRLYTQQERLEFAEETLPEMLLTLKALGIADIGSLEYLDKPDSSAFAAALRKLLLLGASTRAARWWLRWAAP